MNKIIKILKDIRNKFEMKPAPEPNESENEFISRCISVTLKDNPGISKDQAVAICYSKWENR